MFEKKYNELEQKYYETFLKNEVEDIQKNILLLDGIEKQLLPIEEFEFKLKSRNRFIKRLAELKKSKKCVEVKQRS